MTAPDGSIIGVDPFPYADMYNTTGTVTAIEDGGLTLIIEPDRQPSQYNDLLVGANNQYYNIIYPAYVSGGIIETTEFNESNYYNLSVKVNTGQIKNLISVNAVPLVQDASASEIYASSKEITLLDSTITLTIEFDKIPSLPSSVAIIITNVSGLSSVLSLTAYAWGADIIVSGTPGNVFSLSATGIAITAQDTIEHVSQDLNSRKEYGERKYDFPENQLLQNTTIAKQIGDNLLSSYKDNRKDAMLTKPCTLLNALGEIVMVTEYKDASLTTINPFYITRENIKFNGALDEEITLRRKNTSGRLT